jgi:pyridoxamine 5'-phosphate oxidase
MPYPLHLVKEKTEKLVAPQQLTLEQIEKDCWEFLLQGSLKGKDALHTFTLGTCFNGEIELRTLVLRKVEKGEKLIFTHTDSRSPKVKQLEGNSFVGLLFYDPARKIQLRIKAKPVLHKNDSTSFLLWNETRLSARKTYLSTKAPGQVLGQGEDSLPTHLIGRDPDLEESIAGRENFMAISFAVKQIDWLYLHSQGHRRAIIQYNEAGFEAYWINP